MSEIPETTETKIAVISTNIGYVQRDISDIKTSISLLANVYATSKDLQEVAKQTETRIGKLEKSSNAWKFFAPTLSAIIAVVIEYLFIFYLQHNH
ncbi:MAG TPA: hypothetical protein VF974_07660 [Patescibacteria group bacterium]